VEDEALEEKLRLLERSDIIAEGSTRYRYKGIPDDIFNQVFQVLYAEEIENITIEDTLAEIRKENKIKRESISEAIFKQNKGYFLEFMMIKFLKYKTVKGNCPPLTQLIRNPSENAAFHPYRTVGEKHYHLPDGYHRQLDVIAKAAKEEHPSILVECKYREKPVDSPEVEKFQRKAEDLKEAYSTLIPIIYSISGFTKPAEDKMKELGISWSNPELWDVFSL
jgi:hypothetical protein